MREPQIGLKDGTSMPLLVPLTPHTRYVRPGNFVPDGNAGTLQALPEDPQYGASTPWRLPDGTIRMEVAQIGARKHARQQWGRALPPRPPRRR